MKKLKVAFCLRDMQLGGVESVLIKVLTMLQKSKNIDLSVITYVNIKTEIYKKFFENNADIKLYTLYPCSWLGTRLPHFFVARILMHVLRDLYRGIKRLCGAFARFNDIDVFIDYHDFGFASEFRRVKKAKKIAWFHSSVNVFIKRNFIKKLKYYDRLVVLTDACAHDLMELYPQAQDKIVRIYNPLNVNNVRKMADSPINIKGKYFCCVSRLSVDKDIITLLNGFDLFWNQNKPNVNLVIVGDGDKSKYFQQYAKNLSAKNNILFVGAQNNPYPYMKNALANILSSYGEGLPTVCVESGAVSTLNIASDCKYGPREILLDGLAGLLFEPGNAKQLAECLDMVWNKTIDVSSMIDSFDNAIDRFDEKQISKQIISLFS